MKILKNKRKKLLNKNYIKLNGFQLICDLPKKIKEVINDKQKKKNFVGTKWFIVVNKL